MAKLRRINIKLGLREFGIDIPVDDEEIYRLAAKEINRTMAVYQSSLDGQADEFIYLTALHVAVQKARLEHNKQTAQQEQMLEDIDNTLSEYISSAKIK
ncbi:MAG: cell division protein ZapA [Rikenellaceae bacterium]